MTGRLRDGVTERQREGKILSLRLSFPLSLCLLFADECQPIARGLLLA
jgi:hypothetical protein